MKGCVYTDYGYAQARLLSSVVNLHGEPVVVHELDGLESACVADITGNAKNVPLEEIDMTPFKVGNINIGGYSEYLVRNPARQWKQGFRFNQLAPCSLRLPNLVSTSTFNMLRGKYPSISQCAESIVCNEAFSRSFSRVFSLKSIYSEEGFLALLHKGHPVGVIDSKKMGNAQPEWAPGKEYLKELFISVMEGEVK